MALTDLLTSTYLNLTVSFRLQWIQPSADLDLYSRRFRCYRKRRRVIIR